MRETALAIVAALFVQGCATITNGPSQYVEVSSTPPQASCTVNGYDTFKTPREVKLMRGGNYTIVCSKPGYQDQSQFISGRLNGAFWGNLVSFLFIGMMVDISNGSAHQLSPRVLRFPLTRLQPATSFGPGMPNNTHYDPKIELKGMPGHIAK